MKAISYTVKGVKTLLKKLSVLIRIAKQLRKLPENQNLSSFNQDLITEASQHSVSSLQYEARHYHIAYCEFRGRTRLVIEPKTNNEPSESYIKTIIENMSKAMNEIMVMNHA